MGKKPNLDKQVCNKNLNWKWPLPHIWTLSEKSRNMMCPVSPISYTYTLVIINTTPMWPPSPSSSATRWWSTPVSPPPCALLGQAGRKAAADLSVPRSSMSIWAKIWEILIRRNVRMNVNNAFDPEYEYEGKIEPFLKGTPQAWRQAACLACQKWRPCQSDFLWWWWSGGYIMYVCTVDTNIMKKDQPPIPLSRYVFCILKFCCMTFVCWSLTARKGCNIWIYWIIVLSSSSTCQACAHWYSRKF